MVWDGSNGKGFPLDYYKHAGSQQYGLRTLLLLLDASPRLPIPGRPRSRSKKSSTSQSNPGLDLRLCFLFSFFSLCFWQAR